MTSLRHAAAPSKISETLIRKSSRLLRQARPTDGPFQIRSTVSSIFGITGRPHMPLAESVAS